MEIPLMIKFFWSTRNDIQGNYFSIRCSLKIFFWTIFTIFTLIKFFYFLKVHKSSIPRLITTTIRVWLTPLFWWNWHAISFIECQTVVREKKFFISTSIVRTRESKRNIKEQQTECEWRLKMCRMWQEKTYEYVYILQWLIHIFSCILQMLELRM